VKAGASTNYGQNASRTGNFAYRFNRRGLQPSFRISSSRRVRSARWWVSSPNSNTMQAARRRSCRLALDCCLCTCRQCPDGRHGPARMLAAGRPALRHQRASREVVSSVRRQGEGQLVERLGGQPSAGQSEAPFDRSPIPCCSIHRTASEPRTFPADRKEDTGRCLYSLISRTHFHAKPATGRPPPEVASNSAPFRFVWKLSMGTRMMCTSARFFIFRNRNSLNQKLVPRAS